MENKQGTPAKILIVEDESIIAMDIERGLKKLGYLVTGIVNRCEDALQKIQENLPDLILMDIQIKGKRDGIESAQVIHRQYNIPIIFLTAYADERTLQRAKAAEPLGYIIKPFIETDLYAAIEVALYKQQTLVKREREFKLFVESVKDYALFMLDLSGYIISWNKGAERIIGYTQDEVMGKHFSILYTEEDINNGVPELALQVAKETGKYENECWRVRKDKGQFWGNITIDAIVDEQGELHGFAKITRDITERKRMIDELHAAIQMRDDFLSVASHELKTPVTTLLLQLQGLSRCLQKTNDNSSLDFHKLTNVDILKSINICEKQAKKLVVFLDELLDLTRIRLGKINLELQAVNLGALTQDIITRTTTFLEQNIGISLVIKQTVVGNWDVNRLEQIITNLLSNAIKYGNEKSIEVSIDIDEDNQYAILNVLDHGLGIPAEMHDKIFERFERANISRNLGGFGLGLYIVRQIIEAHGGRIQVESQIGIGSVFTVFLPLQA